MFHHKLKHGKSFLIFSISILLIVFGIFSFFSKDQVKAVDNSLLGGNVRLIKSADSPKVYAVINNQKYLIRNEAIFNDYKFDFKNIQIVSVAEKNRYQVTKLVRNDQTGRVYYLNYSQNLKKHHRTLQAFHAYRNNDPKKIITVSNRDLEDWPMASLLKSNDGPRIYYIRDNNKAWIPDEQTFLNNGFQWSKIMTVNRADIDSYNTVEFNSDMVSGDSYNQSQIINNEPVTKDDTLPPMQGVTSAQLIVTLDSSNPVAKSIPFTTRDNEVTIFKMHASFGTVRIRGITITKNDILSNQNIDKVYLEDGEGNKIGNPSQLRSDNRRLSFNFGENPLVIPKNSDKLIKIKVNFKNGTEIHHTTSFSIDEPTDIDASAAVAGIFPAKGNTHMLVPLSGLIGEVELEGMTVTKTIRELVIGSSNVSLARFNIIETSGSEDVKLEKITFTNVGTAGDTNISNLSLYQGNTVIATGGRLVSKRVTYDLTDKDVEINKDDLLGIELRGDVVAGDGRTIKMVIKNSSDVSILGIRQKYSINISGDFPVGKGVNDNYNRFAVGRLGFGFYAVDLDDDEKKAYRDTDNSQVGLFELHNISQDVYLQEINLSVNSTPSSAPQFTGELVVFDITNNEEMGYISAREGFNQEAIIELNNYKIEDDDIIRIAVRVNVPAEAENTNRYRVNIKDINYKIGADNTMYTDIFGDPTEGLDGQLFSVYTPTLTFTAPDLETAVEDEVEANHTKQQVAKFTAAATDGDIKITGITFRVQQGQVFASQGFTEVRISGSSTQAMEGDTGSETYTFQNLSIGVSEDEEIDISLIANLALSAEGKTVRFKITDIDAEELHDETPVTVNGIGSVGLLSDAVLIIEPED